MRQQRPALPYQLGGGGTIAFVESQQRGKARTMLASSREAERAH
jgi:hypothetical protein